MAYLTKRYQDISPVNSGSGVFGYSSGLPQITFQLGSAGVLLTDEIRLSAEFRIVANGNTTSTNLVDPAIDVTINPFNGVEAVVQEMEIGSTAYGRSLERIDHYSQMNASVNSALHSKSMYSSHLIHEQGSTGSGVCSIQALENDLENVANGTSLAGQKTGQVIPLRAVLGREVSMRLVCGMFLGGNEISLDDVGGLTIRIKLAPNESVLAGGAASGYHYELIAPRLTCGIMVETPMQQAIRMQNPAPSIDFLSYSSYYNNIISSDFSVVHKVNLAAVLSSFTHFIPTKFLNNYAQDSCAQYNPQITNLTYTKDGQRIPLTYSLLVDRDSQAASENVQPTTNPELLYHYLSAWKSPSAMHKSSVNPLNSGTPAQVSEDGVFGVGVSYDTEGSGIGAKVSTLGFRIESQLDDPSNSGNQTPFAAFTYYLARNSIVVDRAQSVMVAS